MPGDVLGDDAVWRDPAAVELLDPPDLVRLQSREIAMNFPDGSTYLNFSGLTLRSMPSRKEDQEFVLNAVTRFFGFLAPHWGQANPSYGSPIFRKWS
jgi:hypothetical protein